MNIIKEFLGFSCTFFAYVGAFLGVSLLAYEFFLRWKINKRRMK